MLIEVTHAGFSETEDVGYERGRVQVVEKPEVEKPPQTPNNIVTAYISFRIFSQMCKGYLPMHTSCLKPKSSKPEVETCYP